jgi:hypothetical protein
MYAREGKTNGLSRHSSKRRRRIPERDSASNEAKPTENNNEPLDPIWQMGELAVDTGIPDLSVNIDHYLYGHPKVKDVQ